LERFRYLTKPFYRHAKGIFLVFDITNRKSFENVSNWLIEIERNIVDDIDNVKIMLIGNKSDLNDNRIINYAEAEQFAKENNLLYFETSAKNGSNVNFIFQTIIDSIVCEQLDKTFRSVDNIININPVTESKKCCY
jgi:small GTP-binding protein